MKEPVKKDMIVKLLNEGKLNYDEITKQCNCSYNYVSQVKRENNLPAPKKRDTKKDKIMDLLIQGKDDKYIMENISCSLSYIRIIKYKLGIKHAELIKDKVLKLLYEGRLTNKEIADKLQCSYDYVSAIKSKFTDLVSPNKPRLKAKKYKVLELLKTGKSDIEISNITGATVRTVEAYRIIYTDIRYGRKRVN